MIKLVKHVELNIRIATFFLGFSNLKDYFIEYKCLCCNKTYQHRFDEKFKERLFDTYKFSSLDNNKFISLLRKGVHPYEYMDDWGKKLSKHHYLKKKIFTIT